MLVIYLTLILIFAFVLWSIFAYLRKHISTMGQGQQKVIMIIFFVIVANLVIMTGILVYNNYYYDYQNIGEIGMSGDEGSEGEKGPPKCPSKNIKPSSSC